LRKVLALIALAVFLQLSGSAYAEGPSFNCNQNLSSIEESICANPTLSEVDQELSIKYKNLRGSIDDALELKNIQSAWVMYRDAICSSMEFGSRERHQCLKAMYQSRLYEISNELTALKNENLDSPKKVEAEIPVTKSINTNSNPASQQREKDKLEEMNMALYNEGFMFDYGNSKQSLTTTTKALECAKKLNRSSLVKTRTCYNLSKDLGQTEILFLKSNPICSSVSVDDQDVKVLMFEGDGRSGLSYEDGILTIKNMMNTGNGISYNFNRDSGTFLYQNQIRLQMSECT